LSEHHEAIIHRTQKL